MTEHHFQRLHPNDRAELKRYCEEFGYAEVAQQIGMSQSGLHRMVNLHRGVYPSTLRAALAFLKGNAAPAEPEPPPTSGNGKHEPVVLEAFEAFGLICKTLEPFPPARRSAILNAVQAIMGNK